MFLSENFKNRLQTLAGLKNQDEGSFILSEAVGDLYSNSGKRVKFDVNLMKQAIEGGMEIGLIFQSNNDKYKMPIWKTRIVQPVAMGYNPKGNLLIRGVHVEGQSEEKAIETGVRSAQATNEWRLFKASNIKSMFFTGRLFDKISLPGYNAKDSAMSRILVSFEPNKATKYQSQLNINKTKLSEPETIEPFVAQDPIAKKAKVVNPKTSIAKTPEVLPLSNLELKNRENARKLKDKINKLDKLI